MQTKRAEIVLRKTLRETLVSRGITAAELARKSGVPKSVLSDWLAGANPRNVAQLRAVALVLGVSIEELCFGIEESPAELLAQWVEGVFEGRIRIARPKSDG